jgi:hypothetical protein
VKFCVDIKEEEKVNVKGENDIGSEEEECIDIKDKEACIVRRKRKRTWT